MSTKLEALVNVLKADGNEDVESIEQLIVDNFTNQHQSEYEINRNTYEVLSQREVDDQLYDFAENDLANLRYEMEDIIMRERNSVMLEMLETLDEQKCIDIILKSYDDDTLGEKDNKDLILEESGYYIYLKH